MHWQTAAATYYPQFLAEGCTEKAARSKAEKEAIEDASLCPAERL